MNHYPRAVLFDLDDTLVDHQYAYRTSLAVLYERYTALQAQPLAALDTTYTHYLEVFHQRMLAGEFTLPQSRIQRFKHIFAEYGASPSDDELSEIAALYSQAYFASERAIDGAVALIEHLREAGVRIGVVTNNQTAEQVRKLERCNLTNLIDVMVTSEEAGIPKPDPTIFRMVLERLGCQPHEALMIGDSWSSDVIGANQAGVAVFWLNRYDLVIPDAALARQFHSYTPLQSVLDMLFSLYPSPQK